MSGLYANNNVIDHIPYTSAGLYFFDLLAVVLCFPLNLRKDSRKTLVSCEEIHFNMAHWKTSWHWPFACSIIEQQNILMMHWQVSCWFSLSPFSLSLLRFCCQFATHARMQAWIKTTYVHISAPMHLSHILYTHTNKHIFSLLNS